MCPEGKVWINNRLNETAINCTNGNWTDIETVDIVCVTGMEIIYEYEYASYILLLNNSYTLYVSNNTVLC